MADWNVAWFSGALKYVVMFTVALEGTHFWASPIFISVTHPRTLQFCSNVIPWSKFVFPKFYFFLDFLVKFDISCFFHFYLPWLHHVIILGHKYKLRSCPLYHFSVRLILSPWCPPILLSNFASNVYSVCSESWHSRISTILKWTVRKLVMRIWIGFTNVSRAALVWLLDSSPNIGLPRGVGGSWSTFIEGSSEKLPRTLLPLDRKHIRLITGILICAVHETEPHVVGLSDSAACTKCGQEVEPSNHIVDDQLWPGRRLKIFISTHWYQQGLRQNLLAIALRKGSLKGLSEFRALNGPSSAWGCWKFSPPPPSKRIWVNNYWMWRIFRIHKKMKFIEQVSAAAVLIKLHSRGTRFKSLPTYVYPDSDIPYISFQTISLLALYNVNI
jgi:hypothetical protein